MRLQNRGVTRVSPAIDADPAATCLRGARVVADQVAVQPGNTFGSFRPIPRGAGRAAGRAGIAAMLPQDGLGESGIIRCG